MPGIFGIIGNTSQAKNLEKSHSYRNIYHIQSIHPQPDCFLGVSAFNFMDSSILQNESLLIGLNGEYYTDDSAVTSSRKKIKQLYQKYGRQFIKHIDGIFNIFIYDRQQNRLLIFNDWSGSQFLFYYHGTDRFVFAEELKAILKLMERKNLDKKAIAEQFIFSHPLFDKTLIKEVKILSPGAILEYHNRQLRITRYFDLKENLKFHSNRNKEKYVEKLYSIFEKVTNKYLHKPGISLPLTGGIDSRLLLHFMLKRNYPLTDIYTTGTTNSQDVKIARDICKAYHLPHRRQYATSAELKPLFYANYIFNDGFLPQRKLNRFRKDIWDNNCYYLILYLYNDAVFGEPFTPRSQKYFGRQPITSAIAHKIFQRFVKMPESSFQNLFIGFYEKYYTRIKEKLIDYLMSLEALPSISIFDYFNWYQHTRRWNNVGKASGSYIRELVPSQSRQVVLFAFNLPPELRYWRYLLRETVKIKCPRLARFPRECTGLPLHYPEYMQMTARGYKKFIQDKFSRDEINTRVLNHYREYVRAEIEAVLFSKSLKSREILDPKFVAKIWKDLLNGKNNAYLIHNIVNLEIFLQHFFD